MPRLPQKNAMLAVLLVLMSISASIAGSEHTSILTEHYSEDTGSIYEPSRIYDIHRRMGQFSTSPQQLNRKLIEKLSTLHPRDVISTDASSNVSHLCREALSSIVSGLEARDPWAMKVVDSWGKIGSGLLDGHFKFPGSYDECRNITGVYNISIGNRRENRHVTTNYCTVQIPLVFEINAQLGACVPLQCSSDDLEILYYDLLGNLTSIQVSCQTQDYTMRGGNLAAFVIVIMMISLCVAATIFDGVLQLLDGSKLTTKILLVNRQSECTPLLGQPQEQAKVYNPSKGLLTKTILAFSLYSNAGKLLNTDQPASALTCLNGIRFFSMTWVILGHTLMMLEFGVMDNPVMVLDLMRSFAFSVVVNATVSVDTFFVLSGVLVSCLFLRDFHKRRIQVKEFCKALPMMYLHRYLRLTPAYAFMLIIWTCLAWFSMDGPYWLSQTKPPYQTLDPNCVNYWYLNIFYVNNLFQVDKQCAAWGWYLANDMQFFLISPFIIYAFYRSSYIGVAACIMSILGSIAAAIGVSHQEGTKFTTSPEAYNNFTTIAHPKLPYYDEPWTRYQTYGVGLLAGFLIWKFQQINYRIPKWLNVILWGVSAGLCLAVVYGPYAANQGYHTVTLAESDMYNGFARTAWAVGISFVMISCCLGQGGWVNEFLSWKGFVPLGRLTYCAYLIHIPLIIVMFFGARTGTYYTNLLLAQSVILAVTVAFLAAFLFSLVFEAPFINLDKLYLHPLSLKKDNADAKSQSYPNISKSNS